MHSYLYHVRNPMQLGGSGRGLRECNEARPHRSLSLFQYYPKLIYIDRNLSSTPLNSPSVASLPQRYLDVAASVFLGEPASCLLILPSHFSLVHGEPRSNSQTR